MKMISPCDPIRALDEIVGVSIDATHADWKRRGGYGKRAPSLMIRHVREERVSERCDTVDDHVPDGAHVDNDVDVATRQFVRAEERWDRRR